jgi:hypothetical protein
MKSYSDELNRWELYLYMCQKGEARKLWAPLLKRRTHQPQGCPTLIFENSNVGFSGVLHPPSNWKLRPATPPPFPAQAGPIEASPRDLEQATVMAKPP